MGRAITREEVQLGEAAGANPHGSLNPPLPIDAFPAPVIVVDERGEIMFANAEAEALFGYTRTELAGHPFGYLVPNAPGDHAAHSTERGWLSARHRSGTEIPIDLITRPIADGSVIVVRDVSACRELERFRENALTCLSHDLRNPLSLIATEAKLLQRRLADDRPLEQHAVKVIADNVRALERLVREVLDLAHLDATRPTLDLRPTDLAELIESIVDHAVTTSDRDQIQLDVRARPTVMIDAGRIERVVVNLIHNAMKYAPDTAITIRIERRDREAIVSVIDHGPGLSADDAAHVFEKYRRATQMPGGWGLGLFISSQIIDAHGGRIGVDTAPGRGASFYFHLPLLSRERLATRDRPHLEGTRILVVDDDEHQASVLAELLRDEGIAATNTSDPLDALAQYATSPLDAIVLDVSMPGLSGPDLLAALRESHPGLPAVLLTGYEPYDSRLAVTLASGGVAYVAKPVSVSEVISALADLIDGR